MSNCEWGNCRVRGNSFGFVYYRMINSGVNRSCWGMMIGCCGYWGMVVGCGGDLSMMVDSGCMMVWSSMVGMGGVVGMMSMVTVVTVVGVAMVSLFPRVKINFRNSYGITGYKRITEKKKERNV